ncbi:hypothetical protein [Lyngbya sp. CCY1209]|jgi:hypothetical protein|uniref:hypothetical protein n=1 Tax=Lyngbya sp. CCY1209 TaxID=2886103 RepID=UPI002D1FF332|nr:hypothetical protein [Lyngbya sp. CCY1209]MEB3887115.1 hypothetical protein [Lyngbya sp. CCY1209]
MDVRVKKYDRANSSAELEGIEKRISPESATRLTNYYKAIASPLKAIAKTL